MKPIPLTRALRDAIRADGRTAYELAAEADVSRAVVSRFLRGERTVTLTVADRLAAALNLELLPAQPKPAARVQKAK